MVGPERRNCVTCHAPCHATTDVHAYVELYMVMYYRCTVPRTSQGGAQFTLNGMMKESIHATAAAHRLFFGMLALEAVGISTETGVEGGGR